MIITFLELIINKKYCVNDDETDKKKEKKSNKILYLIFILKYFLLFVFYAYLSVILINTRRRYLSKIKYLFLYYEYFIRINSSSATLLLP